MSVDRWRRRGSLVSNSDRPPSPVTTAHEPDTAAGKKPRVLTKALRSLSSSSIDSMSTLPNRSSNSQRRLHKTPSGSGSMIERLHRRVSRDSSTNSPVDSCPSPLLDAAHTSMEIIKRGPLRQDTSSRKPRCDYIVLTDQCLSKFTSFEAARVIYPQLTAQEEPTLGRSTSSASISSKTNAAAENRLEVPLAAVVAVFVDSHAATPNVLEVWWSSPAPRLACCRVQLPFNSAKDRDDWLVLLHRACRQKMRQSPNSGAVPDNVRHRINHVIHAAEKIRDDAPKLPIFPVVRRAGTAPKSPADEITNSVDGGPSFYLALGPFNCYLVEILRSDHGTPPSDLMTKVTIYGAVTLSRFQATVATHQQTFSMTFRVPFGKETRLTLASVHYRRIIETVMKTDRILKPTWPQHLQQAIFDIRGLSPPLQLTSGNDLGGLDISLPAYCAGFQVPVPDWAIDWNTPSHPCFRLKPANEPYSPLQLIAVFRALRYNGFFKAVSFADVDLSPLANKHDFGQYGDSVVYASANRVRMPEDLYDIMAQASVLEQEIHSLLFASDSLRSLNLSNTLGLYHHKTRQRRKVPRSSEELEKMTSQMLRPIMELMKRQLSHCHSIALSSNPIAAEDVDELRDVLSLPNLRLRRLELADCGLADFGLSDVWTALDNQAETLEIVDLSNNQGTVRFEIICNALSHMSGVTKLSIARNVRLATELSLFDDEALLTWRLQELDLSGIVLNDATVQSVADYLADGSSQDLRVLRLDYCGLNGFQAAKLFRSMGPNREMEVYMNSSRLDEGITDLSDAIGTGLGPWTLFMQMIDFNREESYVTLLRALALNNCIRCLSLAGSSTPDAASETACQAVFDFLAKNNTVRYLDMSGYDSKLDEGRLGRGFSRALGGIRHNTCIEHLRIRSQMLNINVGDLAEALAVNRTLQTVDCSSNDLSLSNLRFLITKLGRNTSIRTFTAFSSQELNRSIEKSVSDAALPPPAKRPSMMSRFRQDKNAAAAAQQDTNLVQELKSEWDFAVLHLNSIMDKNLANHVAALVTEKVDTDECQFFNDVDLGFCTAFGGLALPDYEGLAKVVKEQTEALQRSSLHARTDSTRSTVERPDSVDSSEAAASPSSEAGSSESGAPTPLDIDYVDAESRLVQDQEQWTVYGDSSEHNYTYGDGQDADAGLQMKRHRRFQGDPTNRIEEEDNVHE